ncbi:MAG: hypothetical protein ACYDDA_14720 [Acidiferrobacteraceae bacterium]
MYAVPVVFGVVTLLTDNPITRLMVPLAVPLIAFLGLAYWADSQQTRAVLQELESNGEALLATCRTFIETEVGTWRKDPLSVQITPDVRDDAWRSVCERVRTDPSVRSVEQHRDVIAALYEAMDDLPGFIRNSFISAFRRPRSSATITDITSSKSIFQCCLDYLDVATKLLSYVGEQSADQERCRQITTSRAYCISAEEAWRAYLKTDNAATFDRHLTDAARTYHEEI